MRLNLIIWEVAKRFYIFSLFFAVPLVWICLSSLSRVNFQVFFIIGGGYLALAWFLFSYTPKQYKSFIVERVEDFKKKGFDPNKFEIYSKLYNRYVGWNAEKFLFISADENYEAFVHCDDLIDLRFEGQCLVLLTDLSDYPKIHIQITPMQRNFVEAKLSKNRKSRGN